MTWYAAHIIMAFRFKAGVQESFPVWENVVLIEANSPQEGLVKAKAYGLAAEGDDSGSLTWENQPCRRVFEGVRKLMTLVGGEPVDGAEITFNTLTVSDEDSLRRLVAGEQTVVEYGDEQ